MKSRILSVIIAVFCLCFASMPAKAEDTADVALYADVAQNLQTLEGTVTVQFHRQELYNEGVKLSWHIYSDSGELLVFENERYPLAVENGTAVVPVKIELPQLEAGSAVIRFDLVDEENVYWFSDSPALTMQQDEVHFAQQRSAVTIEGDFPADITRQRLEGNLSIWFENPAMYNDQVKASWHIYGADGTCLAYENERLALPPLEDGKTTVPIAIDFSSSGAVSGEKAFTLRFDLVDEKNGFWFSEYGPVALQAAEARYQYRLGSEMLAVMKYAVTEQPLLLGLNAAADLLLVAGIALLRRRRKPPGPGGLSGSSKGAQEPPRQEIKKDLKELHMKNPARVIQSWGKHRRWGPAGLFCVYCILLFLVYAPYYFQDMIPMSEDGAGFAAEQVFVKKMLEETGEFPLWNKWIAAGIPFTTISPTVLLGFLPIKEMVYAVYIVPVALGAVFAYLYFREIKCSAWASLGMSLVYLFSIHLGGARKSHGYIILATAVFPVILYFIERYFTTRKLRWLLGSSVAMAAQFYLGMFQHTIYADIFLAIYLISFGLHYKMKIAVMLRHGMIWGMSYLGLIAFRLFPMLEQNLAYAGNGSVRSPYETFVSYSIHPIKLIQMVFPEFFGGNIYQAFGSQYSSEMDIELFLGYITVVLLVAGAAFFMRSFRVRFYLMAMGVVFLFSALGAFPGLAHIVYQIPYLGDFRCPARALYLFIFMAYSLAAIGLSSLEDVDGCRRFLKLSVKTGGIILTGVACICAACAIYAGVEGGFIAESFQPVAEYVRSCLYEGTAWIVGIIALAALGVRLVRKAWGYRAICLLAAGAAIVQTFPFTSVTQPSSISDMVAVDAVSTQLAEEMGSWKIWDAFEGIDGAHASVIACNQGMTKQIASINSYNAFNNPNLYRLFTQEKETPMNYSGLLTGSLKARQNLKLQNSLLSMLGVRYLIDSSKIIEADNTFVQIDPVEEVQYSSDSVTVPDSQGELSVQFDYFQPEPYALYEISFSAAVAQEQEIYVDFYAGENYDGAEQQADFFLTAGENDYSAIVYAGDSDNYTNIVWRAVSWSAEEFVLRNFKITKIASNAGEYIPWNPELDSSIYLNENARDILYIPDAIEQIEDVEILFQDTVYYALDRVNYMEDLESCALNPADAVISNIDFGTNQITAQITAGEPTFVNFSQCIYPGWNAYVDGVRTELHTVNGLIMGMEVPAGTHDISFAYEPVSFVLGIAVSGGTAAALLAGWIINRKKLRRSLGEKKECV